MNVNAALIFMNVNAALVRGDEDVIEDFGAEMAMEEDIGEDKDDQGDGDDEFYDDY